MAGEHVNADRKNQIDTSSGINPLGPSKKVKASIRRAVREIGFHRGRPPLEFGKFFSSKFGIPESSAVFAGSLNELVYLIPAALGAKKILVIGPAPELFENAALTAGAPDVHANPGEETGFLPSFEQIEKRMNGVDLVFISNPNRVTGRLAEGEWLASVLRTAEQEKIRVVVDESLIEFTDCEGLMKYAAEREVIVLRTTARFFGLEGLELAFAVSSPQVAGILRRSLRCDMNVLSVEAARTAYKDKAFTRLSKEHTAKEKAFFSRSLSKLPGIEFHSSDSNIFVVKMDRGEATFRALERGGFFLRKAPGLGEKFFTVSVMDHDLNKKFVRILRDTADQVTPAK